MESDTNVIEMAASDHDASTTEEPATPKASRKDKKLTPDQRKAGFIHFQKEMNRLQNELCNPNAIQLAKTKMLKTRSKKASNAIRMLTELLESFGATVVIDHFRAPFTDAKQGESGFGDRVPFSNIWFDQEGIEPHFGMDGLEENVHIYAEEANGYSIATVSFGDESDLKGMIVNGKSICSADENFNGNIGAFFALFDVLSQIAFTLGLNHPLQHTFFLAIALCNIDMPLPAHYTEALNLVVEDGNGN